MTAALDAEVMEDAGKAVDNATDGRLIEGSTGGRDGSGREDDTRTVDLGKDRIAKSDDLGMDGAARTDVIGKAIEGTSNIDEIDGIGRSADAGRRRLLSRTGGTMLESSGSAQILAIPTEMHIVSSQHCEQSVFPNKSTERSCPAPTHGRELEEGLDSTAELAIIEAGNTELARFRLDSIIDGRL